jgi:hypothetical protein
MYVMYVGNRSNHIYKLHIASVGGRYIHMYPIDFLVTWLPCREPIEFAGVDGNQCVVSSELPSRKVVIRSREASQIRCSRL